MPSSIDNNVMIDPTLLIANRTMMNTIIYAHKLSNLGDNVYLPKSFFFALKSRTLREDEPLVRFFLHNAAPSNFLFLRDFLEDKSEIISQFIPNEDHIRKHSHFKEMLSKHLEWYKDEHIEILIDILFEEWIFLQEHSWIISRAKRTFTKLKDAGAVYIEFGKDSFDNAVRRTLQNNDVNKMLEKADRYRAVAKWIAVGGPSAAVYLGPLPSAITALAAGYFLLFDP